MSKKRNVTKRATACAVAALVGVTSLGIGSIPASAATGDTILTGEGDVSYVDLTGAYQVLVPTAETLKFALDPQGLNAMEGTSQNVDEALEGENAGAIVSNLADATGVGIANYGYYPVKATVKLYVTDTGASTLVDTDTDINQGTARKIYLTVTPNKSDAAPTVTTPDSGNIGDAKEVASVAWDDSEKPIAITANAVKSPQTMVFALNGAKYNFVKETVEGKDTFKAVFDSAATDNENIAASFRIGGKVNKNADWSVYQGAKGKKLSLGAVFSFTSITKAEYTYLTADATKKIVEDTNNLIADNAPELTATTFSYDAVNGGTLALSLGTGAQESTVASVTFVKHTFKNDVEDAKTTNVAVKGFTVDATESGPVLNVPKTDAINKDLTATDTYIASEAGQPNAGDYFDESTGEYKKVGNVTTKNSIDTDNAYTYDLTITFADKTSKTIEGVKMTNSSKIVNPAP